jgi:hypothetical protein
MNLSYLDRDMRAIFRNPNKQQLLQFIVENSILPDDLLLAVQNQQRIKAIAEFEVMLKGGAENTIGKAGLRKIIRPSVVISCV